MNKDNDDKIEEMIQEKDLNAPRVKAEDIDQMIESVTYSVLPSGKNMICEITLKNTWTVTGISSTVSKENFDEEVGREISYDDARDKIWPFLGYMLQDKLANEVQ